MAVYIPLSVEGRVRASSDSAHCGRSVVAGRCRTAAGSWIGIRSGAGEQQRDASRAALQEIRQLKDQLQAENVYLRREERERPGSPGSWGERRRPRVMEQIQQVAATDSTVLLLGETERVKSSSRHRSRLGPGTLIDGACKLRGDSRHAHRKRAVRAGEGLRRALARQERRFELADRSNLPRRDRRSAVRHSGQAAARPGGTHPRTARRPRPVPVDVRIIAATHRNLRMGSPRSLPRISTASSASFRFGTPLRTGSRTFPARLAVRGSSREAFGKRVGLIGRDSLALTMRGPATSASCAASSAGDDRDDNRRLTIAAAVPGRGRPAKPEAIDVEGHIRGVLEHASWRIRAPGAADKLGLKPTTLETRIVARTEAAGPWLGDSDIRGHSGMPGMRAIHPATFSSRIPVNSFSVRD